VKLWKDGIYQLRAEDIRGLERIKVKGKLVCAVPSPKDALKLAFVSNLLLPLYNLKKPAGFEVWAFKNRISFCLFSRDARRMSAIQSQYNAVYPNARFRDVKLNFIPLKPGDCVCSASIDLEFLYCRVKSLDLFEYDPLSFFLEEMDSYSSAMLQVMFRPKAISPKYLQKLAKRLEKLELQIYDEVVLEASHKLSMPCFDVLVRTSAVSGNYRRVRETAEAVANAFRAREENCPKTQESED